MTPLQELLERPQFSVPAEEKSRLLLAELNALTRHHAQRCEPYRRLRDVLHGPAEAAALSEVPFVPVSLFKTHRLVSVPDERIATVVTSSGTGGQQVSRVFLDRETASRQTLALTKIMAAVLGPGRLPMVIVDAPSTVRDRRQFSARGAAVLGMSRFGHHHAWVLDEDMNLDVDAMKAFLSRFGGGPFLMFGFTFVVWRALCRQAEDAGLDCSNAILIHGGGWKRLEAEAVSNDGFKAALRRACGVARVHSFYGLAEQVGSVFLEGPDGHLYASNLADVIVRDPATWDEVPPGTPGVLQVLSALPLSYPGHSLLTEDLGVVHGDDRSPEGWHGTRFSVLGRVPAADVRGCSDTHAAAGMVA